MVELDIFTNKPLWGFDYDVAAKHFRLEDVEKLLQGSLAEGFNACVECCDRHVGENGIALHWEAEDGTRNSYSFAELQKDAARFANFLARNDIHAGDVVAGLLPRRPELLIVVLGVWRIGAVYQPLFTAFGPKAIETRLRTSGAKLVVTNSANRPKLDALDGLKLQTLLIDGDGENLGAGEFHLQTELAMQPAEFEPVIRGADDAFLMMSTSGSTGSPKGVPAPLRALLSFAVYMLAAVDLREDDNFWNMADPGWAYGLYYGVVGPLLLGCATTFYDGPFSVESAYRVIKSHHITNLAGAPTAYRMLIAAGDEWAAPAKGQLRVVSSAGEPLNPEVIRWFAQHLDVRICDHYGQTEIGMVVCNHHRLQHKFKVGSAGVSMPGFHVVVLSENGVVLPPESSGILAVDIARSPLYWFSGYWQQPTPAIKGGYYLTGDIMRLDGDGRAEFVAREDDVITSSGYRIGPFDVESVLVEHTDVVEAAVIGKPDPERTEIVKAVVVLRPGAMPTRLLAEELQNYVKKRLSAHAYPREIIFVTSLPKTPSGKVQRFILRALDTTHAK